jgi:hypothetical protein
MKKNLIVAAFLLILIVTAIISIISKKNGKEESVNKQVNYISNCISNIRSSNLTEQQKSDICNCSHEYLFNKYGDQIYDKNFVISNRVDSLALVDCAFKTLRIDMVP